MEGRKDGRGKREEGQERKGGRTEGRKRGRFDEEDAIISQAVCKVFGSVETYVYRTI